MSRFSKVRPSGAWRAAVALTGIVAFGCVAEALAFDEPVHGVTIGTPGKEASDEAKPASAPVRAREREEVPPQPKVPTPKPPRSLFRCWQHGQIIFEGRGYGPLPTSQVAADLKPADPASGRVQVLDMYDGMCILELPK